MPFHYFDFISQEKKELSTKESCFLYLVKIEEEEEKYQLHAISTGLDLLKSDPITRSSVYWPIRDIDLFITKVTTTELTEMIFPDQTLTSSSLTIETLALIGLPTPTEDMAHTFQSERIIPSFFQSERIIPPTISSDRPRYFSLSWEDSTTTEPFTPRHTTPPEIFTIRLEPVRTITRQTTQRRVIVPFRNNRLRVYNFEGNPGNAPIIDRDNVHDNHTNPPMLRNNALNQRSQSSYFSRCLSFFRLRNQERVHVAPRSVPEALFPN